MNNLMNKKLKYLMTLLILLPALLLVLSSCSISNIVSETYSSGDESLKLRDIKIDDKEVESITALEAEMEQNYDISKGISTIADELEELSIHEMRSVAKMKKKEDFGEYQIDSIIRRFKANGSDAFLQKTQRYITPDLLLEIHNKYKAKSDRMILIGWMQAGLIQPQFNQAHPPGAGITLINWELPVEMTL